MSTTPASAPSSNARKMVKIILFLVILAFLGSMAWLVWQYTTVNKQLKELRESPAIQQEKVVQETLDKLKNHVVLPENQTPVVATVEDAAALQKDNTFYNEAQNGDTVVVFQSKAYLYRPSTDRIVNIGPVLVPTEPQENSNTNSSE